VFKVSSIGSSADLDEPRADFLSRPDTVERVKRFISTHPLYFNDSSRIVEGWGWDHTSWPAEVFPTAVSSHKQCSDGCFLTSI
jgi:hypothetical protein